MEESVTPEQNIAVFDEQLRQERAKLESQGVAPQEMPSDREMLHQVVGEQIQQHIPQYQTAQSTSKQSQSDDDDISYLKPELRDLVQELVNIAFTKNLDDALKALGRANNPALTDAFHDVIVDELLNKLIEQKKLSGVE